MNRNEIEWNIKNQRFKGRSLWCVFSDPNARDGMAITFGFWEGEGEYRAVEFPHKSETCFIKTSTFNRLRKTCQECGSMLRDDNNFLKPVSKSDLLICDSCGIRFETKFGSPLTRVIT